MLLIAELEFYIIENVTQCFITAFSTLSELRKAMRALRIHKFGGPDNLKLEDIAVPSFNDSEVLIRVNAAGINPVDTYIREGTYAALPKLPAILGKEVAGIVEDVGDHVSSFKVFKRSYFFVTDTLNRLFATETILVIISLQSVA
jgi:NADPH2:quinone reductase